MDESIINKISCICFNLTQDLGAIYPIYSDVARRAFGVLAHVLNYWLEIGEISLLDHREYCRYACKQIDYSKKYDTDDIVDKMMQVRGYKKEVVKEVLEYLN